MAVNMVQGSIEALTFTPNVNVPFAYGTIAAYVYATSAPGGGNYWNFVGAEAASDDGWGFYINGDAGKVQWYNGSTGGDAVGPSPISNSWVLYSFTKATGSATPRFHTYTENTGVHAHSAAGGTMADAGLTVSKIHVARDRSGGTGNAWHGDMAAVAFFPGLVMTDSEIERLPVGGWDRWCDGPQSFLCEFPSNRLARPIAGAVGYRDHGRGRTKLSIATGALAASTRTDPPGFKFSRLTRRR